MRKAEKRLWFHVSQAKENPGDIKGAQAAIAVSIDIFRENITVFLVLKTQRSSVSDSMFFPLGISKNRITVTKYRFSMLQGKSLVARDSRYNSLGLSIPIYFLPPASGYYYPGPYRKLQKHSEFQGELYAPTPPCMTVALLFRSDHSENPRCCMRTNRITDLSFPDSLLKSISL